MIYTTRLESAKACFNAATPAAITVGLTLGTWASAFWSLPASAPTNAGTDFGGSPADSAAPAMYCGTSLAARFENDVE